MTRKNKCINFCKVRREYPLLGNGRAERAPKKQPKFQNIKPYFNHTVNLMTIISTGLIRD